MLHDHATFGNLLTALFFFFGSAEQTVTPHGIKLSQGEGNDNAASLTPPKKRETRWASNVTWNKEEQSAAGMNAPTELAESFCRLAVFTRSCADLPDYHLTSGLHAANHARCSDKAWNATRRLDHSDDKMARMITVKLTAFVLANYLTGEHVCDGVPGTVSFCGRSARSHSDVYSIPTTAT